MSLQWNDKEQRENDDREKNILSEVDGRNKLTEREWDFTSESERKRKKMIETEGVIVHGWGEKEKECVRNIHRGRRVNSWVDGEKERKRERERGREK